MAPIRISINKFKTSINNEREKRRGRKMNGQITVASSRCVINGHYCHGYSTAVGEEMDVVNHAVDQAILRVRKGRDTQGNG